MTPPTEVEDFESISLPQTVAQAEFLERVDMKYLLGQQDVASLLQTLRSSHRVLEIDGQRTFTYLSRYLDSEDLACYRAHRQGRRRRFKCRIREYVDSGDRVLEVKAKGLHGQTLKFRQPTTDVSDVFAHQAFLSDCIADCYGMTTRLDVAPVLDVRYQRVTLVANDGSERVTLDTGLTFRDVRTGSASSIGPGHWIVETKSAKGRGSTDRSLVTSGIRPVNVSKYILGVLLTSPDQRANDYLSILRRLGLTPAITAA